MGVPDAVFHAVWDDDVDCWCVKRVGSDAIYRPCSDRDLANVIAITMNRLEEIKRPRVC